MTEEPQEGSPRTWWQGLSDGAPDVEALLGPDAMEAVGGVADEALKLFVVLRDRFGSPAVQAAHDSAPQWGAMLGTLASSAVRAVNDLAVQAGESPGGTQASRPVTEGSTAEGSEPVLPGQAAACSYCPVCQAIALFRSVPMTTWQRLATSIVEVADAAREFGDAGSGPAPVVVQAQADPDGKDRVSLEAFLAGIDADVRARGEASRNDHPSVGDS